MLLASLSGSAAADAAALAALLVPMMVRAGHNKATSVGLIASAGVIAPVLPPSIGLILFGVAGNISITKLFLAGIVPGLLMGVSLCVAWYFIARRDQVETATKSTRAERLKAFTEGIWALMLPVIILVGLKFGVFTPTEAGVVAAVYAFLVSMLVYREMTLSDLARVLLASVRTTSMVMFLVAAAMVAAWVITVTDLPSEVISLLEPVMDSPRLLMVIMVLIVLAVGTAMDMSPVILILAPVMLPVAVAAGIDPIYFGVVFVVTCAVSLITPPVGLVLNVVSGVTKLDLLDTVRGCLPFLLAELVVLALITLIPELITVPMHWMF